MAKAWFFLVEYSLWKIDGEEEVYIRNDTQAFKVGEPMPPKVWETFDLRDVYNKVYMNHEGGRRIYSSHREMTFDEYYHSQYD